MGFEPMHRTVTAFGLYHLATATPQRTLIGTFPRIRTETERVLSALTLPVGLGRHKLVKHMGVDPILRD